MKSKDLPDGRYIGCLSCDAWIRSDEPIVEGENDLCGEQILSTGGIRPCWSQQYVRWSINGEIFNEDDLFNLAKELIYEGDDQ
jgi:hypothetical protein